MKIVNIIALVCVLPSVCLAAAPSARVGKTSVAKERPNYTPEELARLRAQAASNYYQRTGGYVRKPRVHDGKAVIFNGQDRVAESNLAYAVRMLTHRFHVPFELVRTEESRVAIGTAGDLLAKAGGVAGVFVVNRKELGLTIVSAPEAGWAIVNVAALAADGAAEPFVVARTQKEIFRALSSCANGMDSQSNDSMMGIMRKPSDLDEFVGIRLPADVASRIGRGLSKLGADPWFDVPYIRACEKGWAPAPTNEIQKAIWDKVHAMPKNPMKIEFDPKKGR